MGCERGVRSEIENEVANEVGTEAASIGWYEEAPADLAAERGDPGQEVHQVLVQAEADDFLGLAVVQARMQLAGLPPQFAAVVVAQELQRVVDEVDAGS